MIKIPHQVVEEQKNFRAKVEELKQGLIEPERFKPYRVSMGIYEQRDRDTYMIRTRIPAGVVSLEQLARISELAKTYGHGYIHFTTRQDIQFHKVTIEATVEIMEGLLEVGIVTRGTGGNTARNVGCSPLSGVARDEVFDVTPYALATTEYTLQDPSTFNLPRKFKIAFANTPADTANATIADLGFVAKLQAGEPGFEVYGGGGLGGGSRVAIKLAEFIPVSEVLHHVQAMKELFEAEGDRSNKHKARIRFIVQRLGEAGFKAKYFELLQKVKSEKNIELFFNTPIPTKEVGELGECANPLLVKQNTPGKYAIYVHPHNGNLSAAQLDQLLDFLNSLSYQPSIRLTSTQGFYIRDLDFQDAERCLDLVLNFTSIFAIDNSVACAGAATCQLGLGLSQNLLTAIKERFAQADEIVKAQLPRIFISGCPNSCGQHQKGEIGLYGKAKRVTDGLVPMYAICFGGAVGVGQATLATEYGTIPAKKVPEFLYQLAVQKCQVGVTKFAEFIKLEQEKVKLLLESFATIEPATENPELYYDFGAEEEFSLKGRGPGECSAGVLDVIRLDISYAQSYLKEYEQTQNANKLYDASVSAARALLILKGVDTTKERLIFEEFIKHFVETGYVKASIKTVIEQLLDYKLGDLKSLEQIQAEVIYLVNRVILMYETLNSKLEVTVPKERLVEDAAPEQNNASFTIVDLKGVKCPLNFVKAKVALAQITSQETIGFYLDDGEPIKNVPKSIEAEGHEIINVDERFEGYNLLVVKKH